MGDENTLAAFAYELKDAVRFVAESSFESGVGGTTMSSRAFGEVVNGCPPESSVSSSSCESKRGMRSFCVTDGIKEHDLVDDIKVVLERGGRHKAKVVMQYLYKRLQERKGE